MRWRTRDWQLVGFAAFTEGPSVDALEGGFAVFTEGPSVNAREGAASKAGRLAPFTQGASVDGLDPGWHLDDLQRTLCRCRQAHTTIRFTLLTI